MAVLVKLWITLPVRMIFNVQVLEQETVQDSVLLRIPRLQPMLRDVPLTTHVPMDTFATGRTMSVYNGVQ